MDELNVDADKDASMPLSEEERKVLEEKDTEAAGSGKYNKFFPNEGHFVCRKCGSPIYSCAAKFDSGCGWPAFDKCYEGALKMTREEDGRIEITCSKCDSHLGHIFTGESHKDSRTEQRHCANSRALQYIKAKPAADLKETTLE